MTNVEKEKSPPPLSLSLPPTHKTLVPILLGPPFFGVVVGGLSVDQSTAAMPCRGSKTRMVAVLLFFIFLMGQIICFIKQDLNHSCPARALWYAPAIKHTISLHLQICKNCSGRPFLSHCFERGGGRELFLPPAEPILHCCLISRACFNRLDPFLPPNLSPRKSGGICRSAAV